MDRGVWRATAHEVTKSQTQVSNSAHTVFILNACSREAPHVENPYWEPIICIAENITSDVSGCLGRLKKAETLLCQQRSV